MTPEEIIRSNLYTIVNPAAENCISFKENMSEKNIQNCIKYVSKGAAKETEIVGIYDFSLLHNAKCAYLFTTKAMYFDGKEFPYADIKEIIAIKGKILIKLKNGKYFENSEVITPVKHENFGDMMGLLVNSVTGENVLQNSSIRDIIEKNTSEVKEKYEKQQENVEVKTDSNLQTPQTNAIKNESDNSNLKNTTTDSDSSGYPDDYIIVDKVNLFKNYLYAVLLPIGVIAFNIFLAPGIWLRIATILGLIVFEPYIVLILVPREKYGIRINAHENAIKYKINIPVKSVPLDEVQTCEIYNKIDQKQSTGKFFSALRYVVVFSGRFGTHRCVFHSEFPQQQLYAALHELCHLY